MPTPRRPGRKSPPQDKVTGRFDHGTAPDPAQEARAADTLAEIRVLSRDPFRRILKLWAGAAPTHEALVAQADKHPDRWAQGFAIFGRLASYSDKLEVDVTGEVTHVHLLSDLELEAELAALDAKLAARPGPQRRLPPAPERPAS
jgi:hypothetical protein